MVSFFSQRNVMKSPPSFPIPGDEKVIGFECDTHAAIFHRLPDYMGRTFSAACQFYLIANEITLNYLVEDEDQTRGNLSLARAEAIYHKLLEWSDGALAQSTGERNDTQHDAILHMWIHCRILDLFRPFLSSTVRLNTFAYGECTTRDIYMASLNQLKRHVLVFPPRYHIDTINGWFNPVLLQTTSAVVSDPLDPEARFWLGVCIRALFDLIFAYPLLGEILQVFVAMAVQKGIISAQEAQTILQVATAMTGRAVLKADYVLDLELALQNRKDARMDTLASSLDSKLNFEGSPAQAN